MFLVGASKHRDDAIAAGYVLVRIEGYQALPPGPIPKGKLRDKPSAPIIASHHKYEIKYGEDCRVFFVPNRTYCAHVYEK